MAAAAAPKFHFGLLEAAAFQTFQNKDSQQLFSKWGLQDCMYVKRFMYDQFFQEYEAENFLLDLLRDPQISQHIPVLARSGGWSNLSGVRSVQFEKCSSKVISLDFFDRLYSNGIVRESGNIVKCFDEYVDRMVISDEVHKVLLMPESEHYPIFSEEDRAEFIFKIFQALCVGGPICQYEDEIQPYLDLTRGIYKDLVSVQKDSKTSGLAVVSQVFQIRSVDANQSLFPTDSNIGNSLFVAVDPLRRHVNVWYLAGGSDF